MNAKIKKLQEEVENLQLATNEEVEAWVNDNVVMNQGTGYVPSMFITGIDTKNYGEFAYCYKIDYDANFRNYKEEMIDAITKEIENIEVYLTM